MRVLLSSWGSRGDVEPLMGFAVALRELGAEVRVCAPPDFAELAARVDVPLIPMGRSLREMLHGAKPLTPADAPQTAANLVAMQFDTVAAAADGCDAVVATGLMPAGVRSIAEKLDIHYVCVGFLPGSIPSPHQTPLSAARPAVPTWAKPTTACCGTWTRSGSMRCTATRSTRTAPRSACHRWTTSATTCSPTGRGWRRTRSWPVAGFAGPRRRADRRVDPARRTPAARRSGGLPGRGHAAGVRGFSSVRAPQDVARVAIEAIRAQGRRALVSRGWADLALIDDRDDCFAVGEVNHQALFGRVAAVVHHGGAGTTTTAARAGAPQVVVPQIADQPYWAGRVADLGIGAAHDGPTPTAESLSAALEIGPDPPRPVPGRAPWRGKIRTDGATVAAKLLIDEVTTRRAEHGMPASRR